ASRNGRPRLLTSSNVIELAEVVPHRSVSQLTTYTACSEQFRLQRVAKAPQQPAAWFIHGSGFHHAIEEYELSGRQMTVEQARQSAYDYYEDRKSTRLNSRHVSISYAVFCLKNKKYKYN